MTTRKHRRPNNYNNNNSNNNHRQNHNNHNNQNNNNFTSDYESDYPNYLSEQPQDQDQDQDAPIPPPLRSNEELNLAVLRRHNPCMNSIVSLAPYAVVYIFSPATRQWEKSGVEGTLFVCNLTQGELGEERYSAFVLNRRGLNNFDVPLTDGENVEITDEYVILKSDADGALEPNGNGGLNGSNHHHVGTTSKQATNGTTDVRIYGLWIYSEPPPNSTAQVRTINAQLIRECAIHAGHSRRIARERLEASQQNGLHMAAEAATSTVAPMEEVQSSAPMGRQVSLKDLFGQQRAQDDGWTVRAHHLGLQQHQPPPQPMPMGMGMPPTAQMQPQPQPPPQPQQQDDVLGNLFRRAGLAYQGGPGY